MSNVLKSHSICLNPESRFMLQKRIQVAVHRDDPDKIREVSRQVDSLLETARKDAESIRNKAKEEAKKLVADAVVEAERIREQAQKEGFQEGLKEGFQAGFQKGVQDAKELFLSEIEQAQRIKEEIIKEREALYNQFEKDLVNLALDIAKRVIYDRLETDDMALAHVVESTLKKIQGKAKVQLKISKHDYNKISHLKQSFMSKLHHIEDLDIVQDEFLSPGSCLVDTGRGIIDGSVDTRLKEIETALVGH